MKKLIKWLLLSIALIIVLVFANGCYYVFFGQERSMAKLREGKEFHGPRYNFSILLTR